MNVWMLLLRNTCVSFCSWELHVWLARGIAWKQRTLASLASVLQLGSQSFELLRVDLCSSTELKTSSLVSWWSPHSLFQKTILFAELWAAYFFLIYVCSSIFSCKYDKTQLVSSFSLSVFFCMTLFFLKIRLHFFFCLHCISSSPPPPICCANKVQLVKEIITIQHWTCIFF